MAVIITASILVVGGLYGANLRAQWSVFDDHEIMGFMGNREHLPLSEIVPKLLQTEVGPQSDLPRFRPAYYVLRLLETWAWGKHPQFWYASHLLILAFFMSTVWSLASARIGFLASGMLAVYAIALPFWSGIFSALGPGETYATLGLAMFLIGADLVFRRAHFVLGWWLLLVGTIIAAGAKENMLLLALALPFLSWYEGRRQGATRLAAFSAAIGTLWCAGIAFIVLVRVRAVGGDVYANPIGISQRLMTIPHLLSDPGLRSLLAAAACFLFLLCWRRRGNAAVGRASWIGLVWAILLLGIYVSQVMFYNGSWPTGTRYDFPGVLASPGLLVVIAWYFRQLSSVPSRPLHRALLAAAIPMLALIALAGSIRNLVAARTVAENNVAATAGWTTLVTHLAGAAREHDDFSVVVQSNDPADFEAVISIPRFLTAYGARNPAYLLWTPRREGVSNYRGSLSDQLRDMSEQGSPGLYMPLPQLDALDTRCLLIVVSGRPRWPCQITLNGDWRAYYQ